MCDVLVSSTVRERAVDAIDKCVIGQHGRCTHLGIRIDIDGFEQLGVVVGEPGVFAIQENIVIAICLVPHHQSIILGAHIQIQFTLRYIDDDANVDIHETWLHHKEDSLATLQWRRFFAFVDGFGIEAHFRFDRQLTVTLMAINWTARVRITAFRALNHPTLLRRIFIRCARGIAFRIVSAIAFLTRHWVAGIAVTL